MTTLQHSPELDTEAAFFNVTSSGLVLPPEVIYEKTLSQRYDANIYLVSDIHQSIGGYKIRGMVNYIEDCLRRGEPVEDMVVASTGTHAKAAAQTANHYGFNAEIVLPHTTPREKVNSIEKLGGVATKITLHGQSYDEAAEYAAARVSDLHKQGKEVHSPHPFDNPHVAAGQGTIVKNLKDRNGNAITPQVILAPVGGGGLLSGIMHATQSQDIHYIGVEPANAASLAHALLGNTNPLQTKPTMADATNVQTVGDIVRQTVSYLGETCSTVSVSDNELRQAIQYFWDDVGQTSKQRANLQPLRGEPSGLLTPAGLKKIASLITGKTVLCIISGGNMSEERYCNEVLAAT